MRRREYYWSLYHNTVKNQLDNLRTDQVEAVFAALPKETHGEWLIWRDGFDAWKPFEDFPHLLISLRKVDDKGIEAPPPPPIQKKQNQSKMNVTASGVHQKSKVRDTEQPKTGKSLRPPSQIEEIDPGDIDSDLSLMPTGAGEDRNNFRFEKFLDVKIVAGEKTYSNKTVNISLKGMQLKAPLPKGLPRYFNVEIRFQDKFIPVVCSEVKVGSGAASNRLKIEVNDYTPALLALLLSA